MTFTFVPSIGRLPTHFEVVDISKFLVTIPEEPKDLSNQKIVNKVDFCLLYFFHFFKRYNFILSIAEMKIYSLNGFLACAWFN